jgi:hypothetical protein
VSNSVGHHLSSLLPNHLQKMGALRKIALFLLGIAALACGLLFGLATALLLLAGAALLNCILLLWSSLQGLAGESPMTLEEALSLGAPSAEEEQKQAVLRALKDLEYERSVGKISDQDYHELSQRYRAEAKALLLLVDRDLSPAVKKAEELLAKRLGHAPRSIEEPAPTQTEPAQTEPAQAEPAKAFDGTCPQCSTRNDADARFCKSCGTLLTPKEGV